MTHLKLHESAGWRPVCCHTNVLNRYAICPGPGGRVSAGWVGPNPYRTFHTSRAVSQSNCVDDPVWHKDSVQHALRKCICYWQAPSSGQTWRLHDSGFGCQIVPCAWERRSLFSGIVHGGATSISTSSGNHGWLGHFGATNRTDSFSSLILQKTRKAEISLEERHTCVLSASCELVHPLPGESVSVNKTEGSECSPLMFSYMSGDMYCPHGEEVSICPLKEVSRQLQQWSWVHTSLVIYKCYHCHAVHPDENVTVKNVWEKARCTARSSRQFMCHDFSSSDHAPKAGLPSHTAPHPVLDTSVITFFLLITWPIWTPLRYRVILRQGVSVCKQSRVTLMCKVPVRHAFCGTRLFNQSWSGRICRSPRLHTVEAVAIWPSVLWKHFSRGERPNMKTARELISFCDLSSNRRAPILIEFSSTPKKEMFWLGTSMLFCIFTVIPKLWIWARILSLSLSSALSDWAKTSQSSR